MRGGWFALAVLLAVSGGHAVRADVVTLRSDLWCPYNCDPASDRPGYVIELARAVFEPAGHTVDYRLLPWSRVLEGVRRGLFTAAVGATQTDGRDLLLGREPVGEQVNAVAVRAGTAFSFSGVESLRGLRLGVVMGYSYDNGPIDAYIQAEAGVSGSSVQVVRGDDVAVQNLRKLMAGRLDGVLESAPVLHHAIARMGLGDTVAVVEIGAPVPVYIAFSSVEPRATTYLGLLDAGIARLRANGALGEILARYGIRDWRPQRFPAGGGMLR